MQRMIRKTTISQQNAFILTQHNDIAATKHREVRRLQAERIRTVLRDMIAALLRMFHRTSIATETRGWDQVSAIMVERLQCSN